MARWATVVTVILRFFCRIICIGYVLHYSSSLVFTSAASTSKRKQYTNDPNKNETRRIHKYKQNHPNLPPFWKTVFRHEVIWIQCFHWPHITTCGKYHCACVLPEQYFVFTWQLKCKWKHWRKYKEKEHFWSFRSFLRRRWKPGLRCW